MFHCPDGEVQPALIEKRAEFVRSGHPDQHWGFVSDQPKSLFAFSQNLFRSFAIRNIEHSGNEILRLAMDITDQRSTALPAQHLSILVQTAFLHALEASSSHERLI